MTAVRVNRLHYPVTALGPGVRVGIWFQGCSIGCRGCVSRDTWDPLDAPPRSVADVVGHVRTLATGPVDGVTITGGEPFEQPTALTALLAALRAEFSGCDLLSYSGYDLDDLKQAKASALELLDAVVTGPYVAGQASTAAWWGSGNQVLTPLTDLGRARYAAPPTNGEFQVDVDADGAIWVIGVPRRGVLSRVERQLRSAGIRLKDVSWRA